MADSQEATEGVQQLQNQIEEIFLEYQKVVAGEEAMAPKEVSKTKVDGGDGTAPEENDLEEIVTVSENIDVLNSALDSIEAQTDRIRDQLLQLLAANREARQYIREENEKLQQPGEDANNESASE